MGREEHSPAPCSTRSRAEPAPAQSHRQVCLPKSDSAGASQLRLKSGRSRSQLDGRGRDARGTGNKHVGHSEAEQTRHVWGTAHKQPQCQGWWDTHLEGQKRAAWHAPLKSLDFGVERSHEEFQHSFASGLVAMATRRPEGGTGRRSGLVQLAQHCRRSGSDSTRPCCHQPAVV